VEKHLSLWLLRSDGRFFVVPCHHHTELISIVICRNLPFRSYNTALVMILIPVPRLTIRLHHCQGSFVHGAWPTIIYMMQLGCNLDADFSSCRYICSERAIVFPLLRIIPSQTVEVVIGSPTVVRIFTSVPFHRSMDQR
jgi:hypothetical protein